MWQISTQEADDNHLWAVVHATCDIDDPQDALVMNVIDLVREAYGETAFLESLPPPEPDVEQLFGVPLALRAFQSNYPDPDHPSEQKKPPHLRAYRSETTEIIARECLKVVFHIENPLSPQQLKTNPNQPILGFDGWGVLWEGNGEMRFVLIQVKGSDEPNIAKKLVAECQCIPKDPEKICTALSILYRFIPNGKMRQGFLSMLEQLGHDELPLLSVAPVIVRGKCHADIRDMILLREARRTFAPAIGRGLSISIGTDLEPFSYRVMKRARGA